VAVVVAAVAVSAGCHAAVAAECQAAVSRGAEWPREAFHVAECHREAFLVPE
jgi:hypothetical protein